MMRVSLTAAEFNAGAKENATESCIDERVHRCTRRPSSAFHVRTQVCRTRTNEIGISTVPARTSIGGQTIGRLVAPC